MREITRYPEMQIRFAVMLQQMAAVTVRRAEGSDREAVLALFRELEVAQSAHRTFPVAPDAEDRIETSFDLAIEAGGECFLIAEEAGRAIGMAHCREDRPSKLSDARVMDLGRVVVFPEARGRGVGRALVDAGRAFARERGIESLSARVFARNEEAIAFWKSLGFEPFVETLVLPLAPRVTSR